MKNSSRAPNHPRRKALATVSSMLAFLAFVLLAILAGTSARAAGKPNILVLLSDQQHAGMLSAAGNRWLRTPALDRLAASGVRFELAYASNPVCLPARFSFMTGRMPSSAGIRSNDAPAVDRSLALTSLAARLRRAGYETVYGGKTHLPRGLGIDAMGFRRLTADARDGLAEACAKFLREKHEKPFFLFASFIEPHDICYLAINAFRRAKGLAPIGNLDSRTVERLVEGPRRDLEEFARKHAPPLPANAKVPPDEPERITRGYLEGRPFRKYVREHWSEAEWRLHRWAYCRLTEIADAQCGRVLDALRAAGLEHDTIVLFTSDHGDHDSAHRLEHKSILYEEAARVPLVVSWPGVIPAGVVDREHLVSIGLDLLPTLCDWAGASREPRASQSLLPGRSFRALAEGRKVEGWRDHLIAESRFGRMVRTGRFKYCVYDGEGFREQLFDLEADGGEMRNLARSPEHAGTLRRLRGLLRREMARDGDRFAARFENP